MISKQEVKHIAKLARLGLSEKEIKKMQKELAKILDYINLLKEVDVSGIEPTFRSVAMGNVWRGDEVQEENPKVVKHILSQAPDREGEYVRVKAVLT